MRGRPLLQWFIFLLFWCLLLIPLIRVTGLKKEPRSTVLANSMTSAVEGEEVPSWVTLRFSASPESFRVFQGERLLFEGGGTLLVEQDPVVSIRKGVAELRLEAGWGEAAEGGYAVEVTLEPDGYVARSRTLWVDDRDVSLPLSFVWSEGEGL